MTAHPHAEAMAQYARDAVETDTPWRRWQVDSGNGWRPCQSSPRWVRSCRYRRKPRTITINGHEVPEPMREPPEEGTKYFVPCVYHQCGFRQTVWTGGCTRHRHLLKGIVHLTWQAAQAHADALLSFTEEDE